MTLLSIRVCGTAVLVAATATLAKPAAAVTVSYTTTGAGAFTVFPGQLQQSEIVSRGCPSAGFFCPTSIDLTLGVPRNVRTHEITTVIGGHSGNFDFAPDTTIETPIVFTFGTQTVTLVQSIRFRQILNNQFQFNYSGSATKSVNLTGIGRLQLALIANDGQAEARSRGGQGLQTQFTLVSGVPEPASWALMIGGFAASGVAIRRRRRKVSNDQLTVA